MLGVASEEWCFVVAPTNSSGTFAKENPMGIIKQTVTA